MEGFIQPRDKDQEGQTRFCWSLSDRVEDNQERGGEGARVSEKQLSSAQIPDRSRWTSSKSKPNRFL